MQEITIYWKINFTKSNILILYSYCLDIQTWLTQKNFYTKDLIMVHFILLLLHYGCCIAFFFCIFMLNWNKRVWLLNFMKHRYIDCKKNFFVYLVQKLLKYTFAYLFLTTEGKIYIWNWLKVVLICIAVNIPSISSNNFHI